MAIDYPAGVYDLYMKYLNEIEQEGIASDTDSYIPQLPYIFEGDGGPDDPPDRRWDKEYDTEDFEALALKDEYGNIKYGLSEEEQALMDQIRGKQGFNLGTDWPVFMGGPTGMFGAFYNRRKASKKAEQDLAALVKTQDEAAAAIAPTDYGQGAASQETQRSYEDPSGGYTGAGEAEDWGGGEKYGGLIRKAQGGRVGYANGLSVYPILDVTQSGEGLGSGITLNERDITYGGTLLGQRDNCYGGIEGLTGNIKTDVEREGETLFKDTMSKEDRINNILGYGDPKENRLQLKVDEDLENAMLSYRGTFAEGGLAGLLNQT